MGPFNCVGGASVTLTKLFSCQFRGHGDSFCHAHIIHYLKGFDITVFHSALTQEKCNIDLLT